MANKNVRERLIDFMRDDGINDESIDYFEYALDSVLVDIAVEDAIDDGVLVVGSDGKLYVGDVTIH